MPTIKFSPKEYKTLRYALEEYQKRCLLRANEYEAGTREKTIHRELRTDALALMDKIKYA